jgi:DNA adenine methylase
MNGRIPHIVQYQGSKRLLAPQILAYMPQNFNRLIEPFAGMAAVSIATAQEYKTDRFVVNDINEPIVKILQAAIEKPHELIERYTGTWNEQFVFAEGHIPHFYHIREKFNAGEREAANMLYLLARCVKGAVRYGKNGNFNQSPDKRRHGTNPKNMADNIRAISVLLKNKVEFSSLDYREIIDIARPGDLVYMDPPYQGVSNTRDNRYCSGVDFREFSDALSILNQKSVDFLVSYDGECGGKTYGEELPSELRCKKMLLNAGLSTQATLLGKRQITFEALYVSESLSEKVQTKPIQMMLWEEVI